MHQPGPLEKVALDERHKRRIDVAHFVYILDIDGVSSIRGLPLVWSRQTRLSGRRMFAAADD